MKYKIEKNIPVPPKGQVRNNGLKFDFLDTMEVGDSFLVTGKNEIPRVFQAMKVRNMRMIQRIVKQGNAKTTVWRVWYKEPYNIKEDRQAPGPLANLHAAR